HYTSTPGLLGIIDTGHLWATDLAYLNDASEFNFGLIHLVEAMRAFAVDDLSPADAAWWKRRLLRPMMRHVLNHNLEIPATALLAASTGVRTRMVVGVVC